jgi:histone-lysine N-methyltransferase SETMAR
MSDELNMKRIAAKFVPRLLTDDQTQYRPEVSMELKEQVKNDPDFLSKVITGGDSCIYGYDPETKQQSSQWKYPSLPWLVKARQVKSNMKSMLICFYDTDRIICKESVPPGQTVNAKFYSNVLRWKGQDKWCTNNWVLHHDKAPVLTALAVQQFLASKNMMVVPHPPYSPELAPCDFFLFP